jgi:hypothetical protein
VRLAVRVGCAFGKEAESIGAVAHGRGSQDGDDEGASTCCMGCPAAIQLEERSHEHGMRRAEAGRLTQPNQASW